MHDSSIYGFSRDFRFSLCFSWARFPVVYFVYEGKSESKKKNHAVIDNKLQFGIYKTGKF